MRGQTASPPAQPSPQALPPCPPRYATGSRDPLTFYSYFRLLKKPCQRQGRPLYLSKVPSYPRFWYPRGFPNPMDTGGTSVLYCQLSHWPIHCTVSFLIYNFSSGLRTTAFVEWMWGPILLLAHSRHPQKLRFQSLWNLYPRLSSKFGAATYKP